VADVAVEVFDGCIRGECGECGECVREVFLEGERPFVCVGNEGAGTSVAASGNEAQGAAFAALSVLLGIERCVPAQNVSGGIQSHLPLVRSPRHRLWYGSDSLELLLVRPHWYSQRLPRYHWGTHDMNNKRKWCLKGLGTLYDQENV
jgi:hypothetical protein